MKNGILFGLLVAGLTMTFGGCSAQTPTEISTMTFAPALHGEVVWPGNHKDTAPRGRLLSDNVGYHGEVVRTGVKYKYPVTLNKQMDILRADKANFGRRLLDGEIEGNDVYVPLVMESAPLVVEFDFRQECTLTEIDVADTRDKAVTLTIETRREENDEWVAGPVLQQSTGEIHRLIFETPVIARYIRLTANSGAATTAVDEVWVWGDARPGVQSERGILPEMLVAPPDVSKLNAAMQATHAKLVRPEPGDGTILNTEQLANWRQRTGYQGKEVVWQVPASPWQMLDKEPLRKAFLPGKEEFQKPLEIRTARNEGESAALFLVNAGDSLQDVTVQLGEFRKIRGGPEATIKGKLSVAGAIWTRRWGQTFRPLFSADNKLGGALMEKYLTNGASIKDFPNLHLAPGGTAMLWLTVHTDNTAPGRYQSSITYGDTRIPIELEVSPVTLPYPNVWTYQWNEVTRMLPFHTEAAVEQEVRYMQQDLGVTVWSQLPAAGTDAAIARRLEKEYSSGSRMTYYRFRPAIYETNQGYMGKLEGVTFDATFRNNVARQVRAGVAQAKALGLGYDEFAFELWDEPWSKSLKSFAEMSKLFKEFDPQARLIANPLFWGSMGSSPDAQHVRYLQGWYNDVIDISIPVLPNLNAKLFPQANAQFYNHPRFVRAMYIHPCPGRLISWEAFKRGYNGWGFYAYYRLRGDAWNDFDTTEFDYQIVYPGPHGAIPTIESEVMRESWDDYRLLTLLKNQKKFTTLEQLVGQFEDELPPSPDVQDWGDVMERASTANRVLPELRQFALDAATS